MRFLLSLSLALTSLPALAAEPAPVAPVAPVASTAPATPKPKTVVGPSASLGIPLVAGKPVGVTLGVQAIVPHKSWRIGIEGFFGTPVTGLVPTVGGDVGVGLVEKHGVGGALALYARHAFATETATATTPASTQVGPGLILLNRIAPTVVMMVPFVVWIDPATKAVIPTLTAKVVFGVPYGK